jgi:hypothetical protein
LTTIHEDVFIRKKKDVVKTNNDTNTNTSRTKYETGLLQVITTHKAGAVLMMELPSEQYFTTNASSIKLLTDSGYEGVYVSFQRPFVNFSPLFQKQGINVDKLLIIDCATACIEGMQEKNPRCVHISSSLDMTMLIQTICTSLSQLKSSKRFVCIDSLSTMALYAPFSDPLKVTEVLVRMVRKQGFDHVTFLLNASEDLSQKRFFKDVARYADEIIHIGFCI